MSVSINLEADIFNTTAVKQSLTAFIRRQGKDFKDLTKRRMINSTPTGRLYRRKSGAEFIRSHRASARGQRPAIDTGKLLNSIQDRRLSETSVEVYAGAEYAGYLQSKRLGRRIMDAADAAAAQAKMGRDAIALAERLGGGA